MSKMSKSIVTLLLIATFIMSLAVNASAVSWGFPGIETYSVPTISSTLCSVCGDRMSKTRTDKEYYSVSVATCAAAPEASSPHKHNYCRYYDIYTCYRCGVWGRYYVKTTMQCEVGMNPYSLS